MNEINLQGKKLSKPEYKTLLPRGAFSVSDALTKIAPILKQVATGDESQLLDLCQELDGVRPKSIRVDNSELTKALTSLPIEIKNSLEVAIEQVRKFHKTQLPTDYKTQVIEGGEIARKWVAVDRVGLYAPGGIATYPSSVIMNVIPSQIAGVKSIAIASPPQKDNKGLPNATILATCELLGVSEVYAIGGAQAIAMFGYGVKDVCEPVDIITGPGNIYVAAAKRALRGIVGIDSEAGPTEILVLADKTANPIDVAADLISQAEHDEMAAAILVTDSTELLEQVKIEVDKMHLKTKHSQRVRTALSGKQSALILVDDLAQGVAVVNAYAPEHLEIICEDSKAVASQIRNAGAIFLDRFSPVSLGDYAAGSNHVLPTGGCACHSSGLSVNTFMRNISVIKYDKTAFEKLADTVITLANAEDLPAHGEAIATRLER